MTTAREHIALTLKRLRKAAGLNVDQVGEVVGKSGKTISAWEVGRGQPDGDELIILCRLFGAHITDFFGEKPIVSEDAYIEVPVYGSIAAGTPIEMVEAESSFPIPVRLHEMYPEGFLLKIEGNSMNRILPNGSYAFVNPCNSIEADGKPYAICVNGYDATVKRVRRLNNGFELVPDSTDPTYEVKTYNYNEPCTEVITIIGEVKHYFLPFDWNF